MVDWTISIPDGYETQMRDALVSLADETAQAAAVTDDDREAVAIKQLLRIAGLQTKRHARTNTPAIDAAKAAEDAEVANVEAALALKESKTAARIQAENDTDAAIDTAFGSGG